MIIAETGGGYRCITQPAHADLAGQFADRWGSDAVDPPDPVVPMRIAAYAHDTGWTRYDRRPHLADDGSPVDFRDMPPEPWIDLYDEGIDAVVDLDPYAGLLVSMHGAGLRNKRYGLSPAWPETPAAFQSFVDREEERQARLAAELRAEGSLSTSDDELLARLHESGTAPTETASRLWDNYVLLQAWDTLSLSFCTTTSPPSYPEISPIPREARATGTLAIESVGDGAFRIDPYPFDSAPLEVTVPARTIRADDVSTEDELLRAYYRADRELLRFRLTRG